jgi:methyl-accepting chemotaxis protein
MEDTHSPVNGRTSPSGASRKPRAAGQRGPAGPKRNGRTKALSLDEQLRGLLTALRAARRGDFSARLSFELDRPDAEETTNAAVDRLMGEIAREFNAVVALNEAFVTQAVRVERVVGREGRMNERASLGETSGGWAESIGAINALIGDLVQPTTEIARVISAVAAGDFTQKMALEIEGQPVKGEFLRIGTTVNGMVDQLSSFAAEVTRVAKEVGTEGKLGGQADVKGVSGTWKDLTDSVNMPVSYTH